MEPFRNKSQEGVHTYEGTPHEFFDGLKDRLLRDATLVKREVDQALENYSGSEEDANQFYELLMQHRKSEYLVNEQTRVNFMLMKSGLDSAQ